MDDGFSGACYGQPTQGWVYVIMLIGGREGLLFDPGYSGKGLAGMIGLAGQNFFESNKDVIFLHTGGAVALFAYGNQLAENAAN